MAQKVAAAPDWSEAPEGPPESHVDRPVTRAVLPFRHVPGQVLMLEYEAPHPHWGVAKYNVLEPVAPAIVELMRMYWELEGRVDVLLKERDELVVKGRLLEGEIVSLKKRCESAEGALENGRKRK